MNEEKRENGNAKKENKIEWGEKGILGFVITATAAAAFIGSNLYVTGLSITLHESIATYFDLLDYVQVTPAWGVPALLGYTVVLVILALCALIGALAQVIVIKVYFKIFLRNPPGDYLPSYLSWFWRRFPPLFLFIYAVYLLLQPEARETAAGALIARSLFVLGISWIIVLAADYIIGIAIVERFSASDRVKILCKCVAYVPGILCFAFFHGAFVAPELIRMGPETTTYLPQEKESKLTGRVVFRLSHSLILLSQERARPLLVVSTDKIEVIETPRAHYTTSPSPSPAVRKLNSPNGTKNPACIFMPG
ncbi:MAG: hypothetical protein JO170_10050 [Verrucomicrobia bacterium]|nr:hypothetical protein [Verrucomicrobiota bacterium]